MSLSWTTWKHWLSVAAVTFGGAAVGYEEAHLANILSGQWKLALVGGLVAGVSAVLHLAQVPAAKKGNSV